MTVKLNQARPEGCSPPESGHSVNFRACVAAAEVIPGADVLVTEYRHTASLVARAERSAQRLTQKLAFTLPVAGCRVFRCAFARKYARQSGDLK
jgi:hypothetical protein